MLLTTALYEVCPESTQPHTMKNRGIYWRSYKIQHCTWDNDASFPFKVGTLGPHTGLPFTINWPIIFSWISSMVWNLFLFKGDVSFGKSQKLQHQNWVVGRLSHLGDLMSRQKTAGVGVLSWWSCQSPGAHSCGLLNHPYSFCRGMFKLSAKFDVDSLPYLLGHFECDNHTVHMFTQQHLVPPLTRTVKLSLFTHVHTVHSPWLPGYADVTQTILIILTTVGLFPDRPSIL